MGHSVSRLHVTRALRVEVTTVKSHGPERSEIILVRQCSAFSLFFFTFYESGANTMSTSGAVVPIGPSAELWPLSDVESQLRSRESRGV